MDSRLVPIMGIPKFFRDLERFNGVCPPNWTITPNKFPFEFSLTIISMTCSTVKGSK